LADAAVGRRRRIPEAGAGSSTRFRRAPRSADAPTHDDMTAVVVKITM
jgi:hypothetical protein